MVAPHMKLVSYTINRTSQGRALSTTTVYDSEASREPSSDDAYSIDSHFSGRYRAMKPAFDKLASETRIG